MSSIDKYAKAIVGAVVAGLAVLQTAMQDDNMTANEWIGVAAATLGALALVWAVPNSKNGEEAGNGDTQIGGDPYTPPLVVEGGMGPDRLPTEPPMEAEAPEDIDLTEVEDPIEDDDNGTVEGDTPVDETMEPVAPEGEEAETEETPTA